MRRRFTRLATLVLTLVLAQVSILLPAPAAYADTAQYLHLSAGLNGQTENGPSQNAVVSSSGRYIMFSSSASNLVADDTNGVRDDFVYDVQTSTLQIVTRNSTGDLANGASGTFVNGDSISSDGRHVVFSTRATNLGGPIMVGSNNLYTKNLDTGAVTFVDTNLPFASWIAISGDGRYVAYTSSANRLVFYDTVTQTSRQLTTVFAFAMRFSSDGHYLMYSTNENETTIYVKDLVGGSLETIVSGPVNAGPDMSADGRYVSWVFVGADNSRTVFRKDRQTGALSTVRPAQAAGFANFTTISDDGRYVAYDEEDNSINRVKIWDATTGQAITACDTSNVDGGCTLTESGKSISADASVLGIYTLPSGPSEVYAYRKITDTTPPLVTGTPDRQPNAAGWYDGDVTITWTSTDPTPSSGAPTTPPPVTASTEGANQQITSAPSCDPAGNCASGSYTVSIDSTPPTITPAITGAKNAAGWYNSPPTIHYTCADALSGPATCPADQTVITEGANQTITGTATDVAGNTATAPVTVNVDLTAPTLGAPTWSANPRTVTGPTTLTLPATDTVSGVAAGEYFLDTDHGQGNNTPMTISGGNLTATITTTLAAGVYQVGIRARDTAGNWTTVTYTMLVVYDPSITVGVTGKNKNDLVPSLANGDILPGLSSPTQTDTVDYGFTVDYTNGVLDPHDDFMLTYQTGSQCNSPHPDNCHSFTAAATGFDWMIIDQTNNSRGRFQGTATVTVDGVTTSNPFTVEGIDGDRLTLASNDLFTFRVYAPGANPATGTPIYQVSGSLAKGNSIKIR